MRLCLLSACRIIPVCTRVGSPTGANGNAPMVVGGYQVLVLFCFFTVPGGQFKHLPATHGSSVVLEVRLFKET